MRISGEKIREARLASGITQKELGRLIDVNQSHISRVERDIDSIGLESLLYLAEAIGVTIDALVDRDDSGTA